MRQAALSQVAVQCALGHMPVLGAQFYAEAFGMGDSQRGCAQLLKCAACLAAAAGCEAENVCACWAMDFAATC